MAGGDETTLYAKRSEAGVPVASERNPFAAPIRVDFPNAVPLLLIADPRFELAGTGGGWTIGNTYDSGVIIDEYLRSTNNLSLALVAGHEIGHVLGLGHFNLAGNLMNAAGGIGEALQPSQCTQAYGNALGHVL